MRLTKKQRETILAALEHRTNPLRRDGLNACTVALGWLTHPYAKKYTRIGEWQTSDWVYWLGQALVEADVLNPPTSPEFDFWNEWGVCTWYYPTDLLVWGCAEYVRRVEL